MAISQIGGKTLDNHLREKRNELMWALSLQDYDYSEIGGMFNMNRSSVLRIVRQKPRDWKPKWAKVHE